MAETFETLPIPEKNKANLWPERVEFMRGLVGTGNALRIPKLGYNSAIVSARRYLLPHEKIHGKVLEDGGLLLWITIETKGR